MKVRLSNAVASVLAARGKHLTGLLLAAAVLHVSVAAAVFMIGNRGLMPGQFDEKGLGTFASDGFVYQTEAVELCNVLKSKGVIAWATWPTQLHVRLYSLPLAVLGRWTGFNILAIEPLNLIYFLAILFFVFKLGELAFDYRAGLLAAGIVAVWPSLLLHTTQLLRDPLLITAVLALLVILTLCLQRETLWYRGILLGFAGVVAVVTIRIVRLPMWDVLCAIIVITVLFLLVRFVRQRRFSVGNIIFAIMMIAAIIIVPRFQNVFHNQQIVNRNRIIEPEEVQKLPVAEQIAARRHGFALQIGPDGHPVPSEAGSDIDHGVQLRSFTGIVRQVPRAALVGFFAPFPNMWLSTGKQVGAGGRLLSGFETALTYVIECLALFGLWSRRKHLAAWLLFLVAALGALSLGLVVTNIGALYRLRYPFWTLLVVLGAGGAATLLNRKSVSASSDFRPAAEQPAGTFHS
jgi:putative peptidoglycan lipid II flippase